MRNAFTASMAMIALLIFGTTSFAKGHFSESVLYDALTAGNLSKVKELVSEGTPVVLTFDAVDAPTSPLAVAVRNGHAQVATYLLKVGANPNDAEPH